MALYLGLDGGGSRLRARVEDEAGELIFEGEGGPANWSGTPRPVIDRSLEEALSGCPPVAAALAALAGVIGPEQAEEAESAVAAVVRAGRVKAVADYHAAWAACDGADVCVIAGTGSLVCSESDGRIVKSGGGGILFGDEGSAASIGRRAVHRYGRQDVSPEVAGLIEGIADRRGPDAVIAWLMRAETPVAVLARIGIEVGKLVGGDESARDIFGAEIEALASLTRQHLLTYHEGVLQPRIALSGGLWDAAPAAAHYFGTCVPIAGIIRPSQSSVQGAVRLARQLAHEHGE